MTKPAAFAVAITAIALVPAAAGAPAGPASAAETAKQALKRGGTVVYLRHGATGRGGCLSAAGRASARAIRLALRQERVTVGSVVAAPGCASRQTALAALGKARTVRSLSARAALRRTLAAAPRRGNTVVVGGAAALRSAARVGLAPAEAAVFRPRAGGRFRLVARARIAGWLRPAPVGPPAPPPVSLYTSYPVPAQTHPHDVAPAPDGSVWYTAQFRGALGKLTPASGAIRTIPLGTGSAPHGVIVGPDGAPWITDSGLNAIVRVDPLTEAVRIYPLPASVPDADLNTAVFDRNGTLWFTGQAGYYGRLVPATGVLDVWPAPRGPGPYGITATPQGDVYYSSLAGSHIARIDTATAAVTVLEPPTPNQGARRVWSDSRGRIWVSEWNAGQVGMFDPATGAWREWKLPAPNAKAYAVYVDDRDLVWLTDFGANAIVRFDPGSETFTSFPLPSSGAAVRQLLGRPGELWGAESATDRIVVLRTG